jgi:hypothetical protein
VKTPLPEGRIFSLRPKDMVGALNQETSQIDVAGLRDPELRIAISRLTASWSQTEIATHMSTSLEAFLVPQGKHIRQSRDVTDSMNLQQSLRLRGIPSA